MKPSILAIVLVLIAEPLAYCQIPTTTTRQTITTTIQSTATSKLTTTTSEPLNDCPHGWIYGGVLGCLYFNTDKNGSVISVTI